MKGRARTRAGAIALLTLAGIFGAVPAEAQIGGSLVTFVNSTTDAGSYLFPSSTYSNNVLYIAFTNTSCATAACTAPTVTGVSGAGLTFTEIGTAGGLTYSNASQGERIQAWRALVASGATTGTVTISVGATSTGMGAKMIAFTGTKTSGTNGSGAVVQSATNSAGPSASNLTVTLSAFADPANRPVAFFSHTVAESTTPEAGYTELDDRNHSTPAMGHQAEWNPYIAETTPSASWTTSSATGGFALEIAAAPFDYRRALTIDFTKITPCSSNLSNFPVLISLSGTWLKTTGGGGHIRNSNGYDIAFRASDGTHLDHEVEKYDGTAGTLVAWVRVPTLSYTANTTIYIYYGHTGISSDLSNPTAVWDSNFLAVWHLKEDPSGTAPQIKNSKSASFNGTSFGTMTTTDQVSGKIDGSLDFDGTDDRIQVGTVVGNSSVFTASAWFKTSSDASLPDKIWAEGNSGNNTAILYLSANEGTAGNVQFGQRDDGSVSGSITYSGGLNNNQWHYLVGVQSAKNAREFFVDGVTRGTNTNSLGTITLNTGNIGAINRSAVEFFFPGGVDEVRISNIARSSCWVGTEYNSQNGPGDVGSPNFYTVGAEEATTDVTVSASGSQTATMLIPSTNQYVGGKFVIVDSTGSRNIMGITLTESGTVNAQTNLDNIKLYYELDTTAPYDGASESFAGTESQFGSTDTDGFSAANGTSAFTGSVGISTTSAMVVYPVLDVGAGAANGETVEISIANASTDVTASTGTVGPASAVAISGTTTLAVPDVTVSASGSQTATMLIPSTNQYVGGKFVIVDGTGSRNVTGITLTESGTVDGQTNLDNIKLYYELDTTAPYDGASESFAGTESQFGSTDTDGFSAANGTSAFSGSVGISTTSAMVVYVVLDVGAGAANGETVEISVNSPQTEVTVSSGTVGPATAVALSGTTTLAVPDVTVSTSGSQTASMAIPSTNQYVGGKFVIVDGTGSRNVTGITLTESGTVNAQTNLDNIKLYYELDTSAPYDGASETFAGTESQFGSTDTDGFSAANGTSTFAGSVGISTTSAMVVYVVFDVGAGAADGETVEVSINNPSTEVTVSAGTVSPATAVALSGTTTLFVPANLTEVHYRWRNDDGTESGFDTGTGADGSVTISSSQNINTAILGSLRAGNPDGIVTTVSSFGSASGGTTLTVASATGFAANDEILLMNLQGDTTNNGNVGNYEFLEIQSIASNTLTFKTSIQKIYGATVSNLVLTGQKVIVQRVPQWTTVTINSGGTLTANDWAGSSGGVVAFRATGAVNVNSGGSLNVNGKGYRGGGAVTTGSNITGTQGESYRGAGAATTTTANGGGGGGGDLRVFSGPDMCGGGGAGGGYGSAGTSGNYGSSCGGSTPVNGPGATYGVAALTTIFSGSGGGGGAKDNDSTGNCGSGNDDSGAGNDGGGIVLIYADTISVNGTGTLRANGLNGGEAQCNDDNGDGGGGSGGSIYLAANSVTLAAGSTQAVGGTGGTAGDSWNGPGGNGGNGRIHIASNSITGTTSPSANTSGTPGGVGATWAANEDTKLTGLDKSTTKRIRFEVSNEGVQSSGGVTYQLQFAQTSTCSSGTYATVPTSSTDHWQIVGSTFISDGEATLNVASGLTDAATTFVAGQLKDAGNTTGSITLAGDAFTEIEFSVQATVLATDGADYCFRLYNATSAQVLDTYSVYAEVQLTGPATDVTVSTSGSQTASMLIPSTNQYVGGKFVIVDYTGSRNVTGITVTESGTVNAQTNLDNIKLFYELDTSAPYDGASESYAGTESQFGSTDTDGFSAANGSSAFVGSVGISTTSAMVVYVVLDVGAGAANGETVEISINNPSTEVTLSTGTVGPATAVAIAGTTVLSDGSNLLLADATGGQISNQFTAASYALDAVLCKFRLTRTGTFDVSDIDVRLTTTHGVANGDVTGGELWADDGDGVWESAQDTLIQGGIAASGGALTFTTDFTPSTTGTNYFVVADVQNLNAEEYTTVSLVTGDIDLTTSSIKLGSATDAVHAVTTCPSDWWDCDWRKRRIVSFDNLGRGSLTNFPTLICLTDPGQIAYSATQNQGQDVRFVDDNGTSALSYEIEQWNESGTSYVWVKVPQINANSSSDFVYMYYDNPAAADGQNKTAVWSNGFESVYHLHDDFTDSSGNKAAATNNGSTDATTNRLAGDYQTFNGTTNYINTNWIPSYGGALTWEGWFRYTGGINSTDVVLAIEDRYSGAGDNSELRLGIQDNTADGIPEILDSMLRPDSTPRYDATGAISNAGDGNWHHIALTRSSTTARFYWDGAQVDTGSVNSGNITFPNPNRAPWSATTVTALIGAQWNTDGADGTLRNQLLGGIDEVRTSLNVARSADWIDATYDNIKGCSSFSTVTTEEPTPSCTWGYRKKITVDPARVCGSSNMTAFPMVVSLTNDNDLKLAPTGNVENASGYDIVFRDANLNDLDFEIEEYDGVSGTLNAWVSIPTLDAVNPTVIYLYYGNPCVSTVQENPLAVWGTDFKGVWHSHDDLLDSSQYNNDVTSQVNGPTTNAAGQIADGENYNDQFGFQYSIVDNTGDGNASMNLGNQFTLSAWVKRDTTASGDSYVILSKPMIADRYSFKLEFQSDVPRMDVRDTLGNFYDVSAFGDAITDTTTWHYIVGRSDGTTLRIFVDGVKNADSQDISGITIDYDAAPFWIGVSRWFGGPDNSMDGTLDEVRLVDTALSDCWIETEYNNQFLPTKNAACNDNGFYCLGSQETTAVGLVSFTATPLDGAVSLAWETGSEVKNLGFHLYRSTEEAGAYERVTSSVIPGLGSSLEGAKYNYLDADLTNGQTYYYKLEDIERTGATELHGPVSATPEEGASGVVGEPGSEGSHAARITYGSPWENDVFLQPLGQRGVVLELVTKGFYAYPQEDGTVRLEVPGLQLVGQPGEPGIPVYQGWVDALAGWKVKVGSVRVDELEEFAGLRPSSTEAPVVIGSSDGTARAGRKKVKRVFLKGAGLYPPEPARVVEVAFQEELKKALMELAPLRWDEDGGRLLLAKKLTVKVLFQGREPSETPLAGGKGRRHLETHGRRNVLAQLVTREPGLYRVRFEDLFGKGGRVRELSELRLSRQGKTVAFSVSPNGKTFRGGSVLYFLSEGADANPYGDEAVYELEESGDGVLMEKVNGSPRGAVLAQFRKTVKREENRLYQAAFVEAEDLWQWDWIFGPMTKSFTFQATQLAPTTEPSLMEVWLQGASDFDSDPDHHVRVYVNGNLVAEDWWDGELGRHLSAELGPGVLQEGDNVLQVEDVGDTEATYSMVMLDRFAVSYPSQLVTEAGELEGIFEASGAAWVSGLQRGVVLDVTEGDPRWLTGVTQSGSVGFAAEQGHRYRVFGEDALRAPEVRAPLKTGLRSELNAAEYLVIGPRKFLSGAEPLLRYRLNEGLRTKAVAVEDIYAEFGYGEATPDSIREFLSYAYHHWSPPSVRYVLLLGDATYDPKDYLGTGVKNQVPVKLVKTEYVWTASDPWFASVNGEDLLPDLAIGRLPAASVAQVQSMVQKILEYETGERDPDAPVVLITDNPDKAGDFDWNADDLASTVLAGQDVRKIYLSQLGTTATRSAIVDAFDNGASIMSYIGHGAIHLWANENLFNVGKVSSLSAQSQQPILFTMNCLNGYFHFPYQNSLSEELLKAEGKGIIAAFSPTGLSLDEPAHRLHRALLDEVVHHAHERLGDAVLAGQSDYASSGAFPELLSIYHLLGDPAMNLR